MCENLYGVFGFIVLDTALNKVFIGRDTYGVRPLFRILSSNGTLGVCSEAKGLINLGLKDGTIEHVLPGSFQEYNLVMNTLTNKKKCEFVREFRYHIIGNRPKYDVNVILGDDVYENIRQCITNAVQKRIFGERKIGCLLSGGLGSSLVCGLIAKEFEKMENMYPIRTFSIGMGKESHDLVASRLVFLKYYKLKFDYVLLLLLF